MREGRTTTEWRKEGREKNGEDLSVKGRRRRRWRSGSSSSDGGGGGSDTSEFLIIATATSHLATGYTMAAVALATAWSRVGYTGRMMRRAGRETGRQME